MWYGATSSPTYSVKDFKTKIGGRRTVVQLWKGYYPTIAGAGGVGAEIGLYQNPPWWASALWCPDYKHPRNINYNLVYKKNGTSY